MFLKKNQNAPRPSEHPPESGGKNVKTFCFVSYSLEGVGRRGRREHTEGVGGGSESLVGGGDGRLVEAAEAGVQRALFVVWRATGSCSCAQAACVFDVPVLKERALPCARLKYCTGVLFVAWRDHRRNFLGNLLDFFFRRFVFDVYVLQYLPSPFTSVSRNCNCNCNSIVTTETRGMARPTNVRLERRDLWSRLPPTVIKCLNVPQPLSGGRAFGEV